MKLSDLQGACCVFGGKPTSENVTNPNLHSVRKKPVVVTAKS